MSRPQFTAILGVVFILAAPLGAAEVPRTTLELVNDLEMAALEENDLVSRVRENAAQRDALAPELLGLAEEEKEIERAIREANAYCKGEFGEAEYNRRKAQCARSFADLETRDRNFRTRADPVRLKESQRLESARDLQSSYQELMRRLARLRVDLAGRESLRRVLESCDLQSRPEDLSACLHEHWERFEPAREPPPPAPPRLRKFKLQSIKGVDYYVLTSDGRRLTGPEAARHPLDNGARVITGPRGRVQAVLPDETVFTCGPNGDMQIDDFVYDPNERSSYKVSVLKGVFRYVTLRIASREPDNIRVSAAGGDLGIRGTHFEVFVPPEGRGHIKLFSGKLVFIPKGRTDEIEINARQMISFDSSGGVDGPKALE